MDNEELRDKLDEIFCSTHAVSFLMLISSFLHAKCKDYALSKMKEGDFISLKDANNIQTNNIFILKGKDKIASTLRKTSKNKYDDLYDEKLISTIEKMIDVK